MSGPLVSVCMPCHNAGKYVAEALDSVFGQTYSNVEVIVVEDASSDNSAEVLKGYISRGVRVITEKCGTASRARNRAMKDAKGKYIKFMDADDLISPNMIESQLNALHEDADTVAVSAWGRFYRDDFATYRSSPDDTWADLSGPEWLVRSYMRARPMMQAGMFLIPTSLIAQVGGWNEKLTLIDDFEFFSRLISNAHVKFVGEATLHYRSGLTGSLSSSKCDEAVGSAYLSATLGVQHLLAKRADECAKKACANIMQSFVYEYYPTRMDLIKQAEDMVQKLGGSKLEPGGGGGFHFLRGWLGWKVARRLQRAAGR